MNVPPTPWWTHYTLQQPWPLALGLGVAGLILLWTWLIARSGPRPAGRTFGDHWRLPTAIGLLVAAVGLVIAAREIETSTERLTRLTESFVAAAVVGDAATTSGMLAEEAELQVGRNASTSWGPFWINAQVRLAPNFLQGNTIREIESGLHDRDRGETWFAQTTRVNNGQPIPNEWRFTWVRTPDGEWKLSRLHWEKWNLGDEPSPSLLMGR